MNKTHIAEGSLKADFHHPYIPCFFGIQKLLCKSMELSVVLFLFRGKTKTIFTLINCYRQFVSHFPIIILAFEISYIQKSSAKWLTV